MGIRKTTSGRQMPPPRDPFVGVPSDYSRLTEPPGAIVYTIEAAFPLDEEQATDREEIMRRALDALQEFGGAEVVGRSIVRESFDDACRILRKRSRDGLKGEHV